MANTGPEAAASDGPRILIVDEPVVDLRNTGNEPSRIEDGRRKYEWFGGTTTRWDDKPFTHQTAPYGLLTKAHRCSSTCEYIHGFVSGRPATFLRPKSTNDYHSDAFEGHTVQVTGPRCKCYGAGSAMDFRRNDGPTEAAVVSSANTDTATTLRKTEKRHWLKKHRHANAFPITRGMKRPSVSLGTIAPKRLRMTQGANGLRRLSTTRGTQMKRSRWFRKSSTSPVAKSRDGERLSTASTATSVHHPAAAYNVVKGSAPVRRNQRYGREVRRPGKMLTAAAAPNT